MKNGIHFKCVKGILEFNTPKTKEGTILSHKNEIWRLIEIDESSYLMRCVEGPNIDFEFNFTLNQMINNFEWVKHETT